MVLTVSQINTYIKTLLDGDNVLKSVFITGEITNCTRHYKSGHIYFSLSDGKSLIKAVMFQESALRLKFKPEDGMKVIVSGRISVYDAAGQYQLYVKSMQPDGVGSEALAFEQLKEKLEKEGIFSKNRSLPLFPEKIAVVTSRSGAALQDILNILKRRWPCAEVLLFSASVQGESASKELTEAIKRADKKADVIIIGRGGGAKEDLSAFNNENLARAIYSCETVVVSAVGHETDFTICDFASDLRAPTPSAAAELVSPDVYEIMDYVIESFDYMKDSVENKIERLKLYLDALTSEGHFMDPSAMYKDKLLKLDILNEKLLLTMKNIIKANFNDLANVCAKLDELSPLKTLSRGYAALEKDGKIINKAKNLSVGDSIKAVLQDGEVLLEVKDIKLNGE